MEHEFSGRSKRDKTPKFPESEAGGNVRSDTDSSHGSVQRNIRTIATAGRIPDRRVSPSGGKDRFG